MPTKKKIWSEAFDILSLYETEDGDIEFIIRDEQKILPPLPMDVHEIAELYIVLETLIKKDMEIQIRQHIENVFQEGRNK